MRAPIVMALVGVLAASVVTPLCAQDQLPPRPPDSLRADSLRAKAADTISTTDRLLKVQKDQRIELRPMPSCGTGPLHPAGTRVVFTRDSIDWAAAQSVGELLQRVPGVFLQRSEWIAGPELPNFFGRGAASVSYELDCVPMLPLGVDSVAIDPSPWPLVDLDRVEVETGPGAMRVLLFTRRHDRAAPRTKVGVAQGDRGLSGYSASFERRYATGVGLGIGVNYLNLNPPPGGTGGGNLPSLWLQLGYVRSAHLGIQGQVVTTAIDRNLLLDGTTLDTLSPKVKGTRTDMQLRGAWRERDDGLGKSLDVFYAHTSWASDTVPGTQGIGGVGAVGALRRPTWSAQLSTWHFTRQLLLDSHLDLGWAPTDRISASVQLVAQRHDEDRSSRWATARIGLRLPAGFRIGGVVSGGSRVQTPTILDDVAQRFSDAQVNAGFDSKPLTVELGYANDAGWRPRSFSEFVAVPYLASFARTEWMTAHLRVAPVGFFTLETVFQNPVSGGRPDAFPPKHFLSTATLRSRFLRNFPSGIFDLKLQGIMESWGTGIGGRDREGEPIPLPGATFFRAIVQMQIGSFIVYYDKANMQVTKTGYVPRYRIQPAGGSFGIRWEFSN